MKLKKIYIEGDLEENFIKFLSEKFKKDVSAKNKISHWCGYGIPEDLTEEFLWWLSDNSDGKTDRERLEDLRKEIKKLEIGLKNK